MDIKDLNKISIKDYLVDKGIYPVKDRVYYGMYHSPFRDDSNASMKIDYNKNLWIDFGSNEGGTVIDLVMRMNNCSLIQAIDELKRYDSVSVNQYNSTIVQQQNSFSFHGINILSVESLSNKALLGYLNERYIDTNIAKQHCSEVRYMANNKEYFAVGFRNDSQGWVLRNKYFKGCSSMDISTYSDTENIKNACLVFEGFMDYLSYLTLKNIQTAKQDIIVLNSVSNLTKATDLLKAYKEIHTCLDNDESGKKATKQIENTCVNSIVKNQSVHYSNYKDLNDYLKSQRLETSKKAIKPAKPRFKM